MHFLVTGSYIVKWNLLRTQNHIFDFAKSADSKFLGNFNIHLTNKLEKLCIRIDIYSHNNILYIAFHFVKITSKKKQKKNWESQLKSEKYDKRIIKIL